MVCVSARSVLMNYSEKAAANIVETMLERCRTLHQSLGQWYFTSEIAILFII